MTNLPSEPRTTYYAPSPSDALRWIEIHDGLWIASRDDRLVGRVTSHVTGWFAQYGTAEPLGLFPTSALARAAVEGAAGEHLRSAS